mgnify:FL=1
MEKEYIGLSLKEAIKKAHSEGFIPRIMKQDEITYFGTQDLRFDRLNFEIEKSKITKCYVG